MPATEDCLNSFRRAFLDLTIEKLKTGIVNGPQICKLLNDTRRAGFTNKLCRLKPRASRSKGASSKLWFAQSQLSVGYTISSMNIMCLCGHVCITVMV